jgi:hypothetical protein
VKALLGSIVTREVAAEELEGLKDQMAEGCQEGEVDMEHQGKVICI